jgi:hypothetical protein
MCLCLGFSFKLVLLLYYLLLWTMSKSMMQNSTPPLRLVSTAAMMRQCNAAYIVQWRGSRASLEATGCCHWASICSVSSRRTTGLHARKKQRKKHHTCWPFRWPWWCAGTIPHALPDRGGPGLQWKPLVDATGQVLWAIVGNRTKKRQFFRVFSSSTR